MSNKKGKEALDEMEILFDYLEITGTEKYCTFDLSLARGLDYYTGLIYETVLTDTDKVGSISGGGRFDNLVGMFSRNQIPAVGVSIGIERIFNILEEKYKDSPEIRSVETEVFVAVIGKNLTKERFKVLNELLWSKGIQFIRPSVLGIVGTLTCNVAIIIPVVMANMKRIKKYDVTVY